MVDTPSRRRSLATLLDRNRLGSQFDPVGQLAAANDLRSSYWLAGRWWARERQPGKTGCFRGGVVLALAEVFDAAAEFGRVVWLR